MSGAQNRRRRMRLPPRQHYSYKQKTPWHLVEVPGRHVAVDQPIWPPENCSGVAGSKGTEALQRCARPLLVAESTTSPDLVSPKPGALTNRSATSGVTL